MVASIQTQPQMAARSADLAVIDLQGSSPDNQALAAISPAGKLFRMDIQNVTVNDAAAIAAIYNPYIANTCVTFETDAVSAQDMRARIAEACDSQLPWLVATDRGSVVGYAYASRWKGRCAYRHSAESTVYLNQSSWGQGIGRALYTALVDRLRAQGIHAVIGGIALPNDASIALHERLGFEKVAHFKQVGFKQDHWIDVGYWQLLLHEPRALSATANPPDPATHGDPPP